MNKRNDKVSVAVNIFGEDYSIRGTEPREYIEKLAAMVDDQMRVFYEKNPNLGISRLAILTALNMADELCKEREKNIPPVSPRKKKKEVPVRKPEDGALPKSADESDGLLKPQVKTAARAENTKP